MLRPFVALSKQKGIGGAGRGILLKTISTAFGISNMQCFAVLEVNQPPATSNLTPSGEEKQSEMVGKIPRCLGRLKRLKSIPGFCDYRRERLCDASVPPYSH
jgi:hypothetical protein